MSVPLDQINHKEKPKNQKRHVMWKILTISILTLGLLIPLTMIEGIITERQSLRDEVIQEVSSTWAAEQIVMGPILTIPYKKETEYIDENGTKSTKFVTKNAYLLPDNYHTDFKIAPETRSRSIYETVVYTSKMVSKGDFDLSFLKSLEVNQNQFLWNEAFITFSLSDVKGIGGNPQFTWNKKSAELLPGISTAQIVGEEGSYSGLHSPVEVSLINTKIPFELAIDLKGSQALSVAPIGKQTTIAMSSDWKTPSFRGYTLPNTRKLNDNGFSGSWEIPYFSRSYAQVFDEVVLATPGSQVGVELLTPVDFYRQANRAIKYGILFLVLTFATYFIFETITKNRVHPLQYLLIGMSLCLFYLLLISFAEILGFTIAYTIASIATISLISLYSKAILGRLKKNSEYIIAGLLSVLYGYLYILLQLQDYSLLFGSLGLFIVLTTVMYITRNIDWYNDQATE